MSDLDLVIEDGDLVPVESRRHLVDAVTYALIGTSGQEWFMDPSDGQRFWDITVDWSAEYLKKQRRRRLRAQARARKRRRGWR